MRVTNERVVYLGQPLLVSLVQFSIYCEQALYYVSA